MSTSRAESQYGRRRSNTAQSLFRNPPQPLNFGDSKVLSTWVHDLSVSPNVLLNQAYWPGVTEGDLVKVTPVNAEEDDGFLFVVPSEYDHSTKPQLQISVPKPVAERFNIRNNGEVTVTKVERAKCQADYVEFTFQDQYLGRNDMWRLGEQLVGQCVHADQEISFIGSTSAKVDSVYIDGEKVPSGYMSGTTKAIYRSLSAKVTIFIQVCRELWEFAGDGERFNEKIVHSFLPELFARWRDAGTNHTVTIVLISRVYYDSSEVDYAEGPLREDEDRRYYKDFFKVITDLEVIHDWQSTLVSLKDSFWAFQRDILLTHHFHRASQNPSSMYGFNQEEVRLVGQLSFAHDGPLLEALNMSLNPSETHYIDRSLSHTGSSTIVITPGTGYYRVDKQLLRLTTTRMLDQGFGLDLVSLAKPPLHRSPIFSFRGVDPEAFKTEKVHRYGSRALDPLWGGDDTPNECIGREKKTFYWEPFWIEVSFWDKQMDLPLRQDRFVARAKMHEIQMLGLLDHDVLSSIEVPLLPEQYDSLLTPVQENEGEAYAAAKREADDFDMDVFAFRKDNREFRLSNVSRLSGTSSSASTVIAPSLRSSEKRPAAAHRSANNPMIAPIEESPQFSEKELPPEETLPVDINKRSIASASTVTTSPQLSIRSLRSEASGSASSTLVASTTSERRSRNSSASRATSLTSKLTSSWLFSPFRSGPSPAETSPVSASGESTPAKPARPMRLPPTSSPLAAPATMPDSSISVSPQPVPIRSRASRQKVFEETIAHRGSPHRGSLPRYSPVNTPPRDEPLFDKRRNSTFGSTYAFSSSSSPATRYNPSTPQVSLSYSQASLARRWQHTFPRPLYKHEVKWKSMVTPACLSLTTEQFPTSAELDTSYDVFSYDFVVDPPETKSFLVKPPSTDTKDPDELRRAWALVVMRGMIALRLAQGFQFVLRPAAAAPEPEPDAHALRRSKSYMSDDDMTPKPGGAAEVLRAQAQADPVYLSMSNEIHRIAYTGEAIQVRRYVRRMPPSQPFNYKCLIWPKLGVGYTELSTSFTSHGLENYGWNRLDMLVAGYEHQFNESLRYWRTRFIVIPTAEPPSVKTGPAGEPLNDEEIRIIGIEKLAEMFSRVRWQSPDDHSAPMPPVRFLPTYLGPTASVLDDQLMAQLDEIHAAGPLRKKMKSERDIGEMSLAQIAKAMREEDGVQIKERRWHTQTYAESFVGSEFVNWLVREFRDVSTRDQAIEWGNKLQEQGLFSHVRGRHAFLDGYYFYQLKGEFAVVSTPRGWFRTRHTQPVEEPGRGYYPSSVPKPNVKKPIKRLILSQSMVIDVDPGKKSDQAESVILHHDIMHNPATIFHFELHWIGTTARCIEEMVRQWSSKIERYGLKLVEAYVTQISDIARRNPFQSCFPVRLAVPPPLVLDIEKRVPEATQASRYFEYALLRRFGFVLDIEAAALYPAHVDAVYSYRRAPFAHSQFVHRSGVAFVQVLGGAEGFLFLTNRLMATGRMGSGMVGKGKGKEVRPATLAEELRIELQAFCADKVALERFYDEELARLRHVPEEPPALSI